MGTCVTGGGGGGAEGGKTLFQGLENFAKLASKAWKNRGVEKESRLAGRAAGNAGWSGRRTRKGPLQVTADPLQVAMTTLQVARRETLQART